MKSVSMSGSLRENVGKKDAKAQRNNGFIPCVMYGGKEQFTFTVDVKQFQHIIYTPEVKYATMELNGKTYNAIVQDAQYHPISGDILHVDFLEVADDRPITIGIPIAVTGTSPGVLRGGKLVKKVRKLKVKGLLKNIPEQINVPIDGLDIAENVKVCDLSVNNLTIVEPENKIVVTVSATRNMEAAPTV